MIRVSNINKRYDKRVIFNDYSVEFSSKGLYLVSGDSGVGKSSLLNIIIGKDKDYAGKVEVTSNIFSFSISDSLIDNFKVKEFIELNKEIDKGLKIDKRIYNKFLVKDILNKKISSLSLGEKQRLGLLLAFSSSFKIIVLDEPFSNLDHNSKIYILNKIERLKKDKLVIIASHELEYLKGYIKIDLNKKESMKVSDEKITNNINKINIRENYYVLLLLFKDSFKKLLLFISLLSLSIFSFRFNNDIKEFSLKYEELDKDIKLGYLTNSHKLDSEIFYKDIVLNLANCINEYGYVINDYNMYDTRVKFSDDDIGNGFMLSNVNDYYGLDDNEIIIAIDKNRYLYDLGYAYVNSDEYFSKYINKSLVIDYKGEKLTYIIKDVWEGNGIYVNSKEIFIKELKRLYKKDFDSNKYFISVYKNKYELFLNKINNIDALTNFDFILFDSDNSNDYFLVELSDNKYFKDSDSLKYLSCIGVSCNMIDFSKLKDLYLIEDINVKDKIKYEKIDKDIDYDKIIVSKGVLELVNKSVGDFIDLKFYIDGKIYGLDKVVISEVINDNELKIYHNRYDGLLYREIFKLNYRNEYLYDYKLDKIGNSLDYELVSENIKMIFEIEKILVISLYFLSFISFIINYLFDICKNKKESQFYKYLVNNGVSNVINIRKKYLSVYLFLTLLFINNFILFISLFLFVFSCNYLLVKKIKKLY